MHNILPILITVILLTSCSSSGGPVGWSGPYRGSEDYEGRPTAAVAPVVDHTRRRTPHDDRLHGEIQRNIQHQLDESGIFAGVVTLEHPDDGHEAEVVIEPVFLGSGAQGSADIELRVRVSEKTKHRTVLDKTYEGSGGRVNALNVAVSALKDDLADRYGN